MNADDVTARLWLETTCPVCLSMRGQSCVTAKGKHRGDTKRLPHAARIERAKRKAPDTQPPNPDE